MEKVPLPFLLQLAKICRGSSTPLISNDTAGQFRRFNKNHFLPSEAFQPDGGFVFTGGHMGICFLNPEIFVEKPLAMISTWDGDEYSLQAYANAILTHDESNKVLAKTEEKFTETLRNILSRYEGTEYIGEGAYGWIKGNLPIAIATLFSPRLDGKGLLVCPNRVDMDEFISVSKEL